MSALRNDLYIKCEVTKILFFIHDIKQGACSWRGMEGTERMIENISVDPFDDRKNKILGITNPCGCEDGSPRRSVELK